MPDWSFLGRQPHSTVAIGDLAQMRITGEPGIYVLIAGDGTDYKYPKASSSIFYIGMAESLRKRLGTHRRRAAHVKQGTARGIEWPRYEYAAAHGCQVAAFPVDTFANGDLRRIESEVISLFAARYGAPPIANGAANLKTVLRLVPAKPPLGLDNRSWVSMSNRRVRPAEIGPSTNRGMDGATIKLAEQVLILVNTFDPELVLRYREKYVGFTKAGRAWNFAKCRPRKSASISIEIPLRAGPETSVAPAFNRLFAYNPRGRNYVGTFTAEALAENSEGLTAALKEGYDARGV